MCSQTLYCQKCAKELSEQDCCHAQLKLCCHCLQQMVTELEQKVLHLSAENQMLRQSLQQDSSQPQQQSKEAYSLQQKEFLSRFNINDSHWVSIPAGYLNEQAIAAFEMLNTPVSFAMYDRFCDDMALEKPSDEGWGRDNRPVIHVDYYQVQAYIDWLNEKTHWHCSLPSEQQWEYACRAGVITQYWYGDFPDPRMMVVNGTQTMPTPGKRPANPWGLYDMHGNVWEWTCSKNGSKYILCGGSWYNCENWLTSSARNISFATASYNNWGFRIIRQSHY